MISPWTGLKADGVWLMMTNIFRGSPPRPANTSAQNRPAPAGATGEGQKGQAPWYSSILTCPEPLFNPPPPFSAPGSEINFTHTTGKPLDAGTGTARSKPGKPKSSACPRTAPHLRSAAFGSPPIPGDSFAKRGWQCTFLLSSPSCSPTSALTPRPAHRTSPR